MIVNVFLNTCSITKKVALCFNIPFVLFRLSKERHLLIFRQVLVLIVEVGCDFLVAIVSLLPLAEFGPYDHLEDAPHFR